MPEPMVTIGADSLSSRAVFEAACRRRAACTILGQFPIAVDPDDASLTPCLVRDGFWEAWVSLAIARAVQPGAYCVDVGAHVGYYSLLMAARGAVKVLAVEPQQYLARLCRSNALRNNLWEIIDVREIALSDRDGMERMSLYGTLTGSTSFVPTQRFTSTGSIVARTTRLDALIGEDWPRLDLIKIDCEGAEPKVWAGMQRTLKRFPDAAIAMEVGPDRGYDVEDFCLELAAQGFPLRIVGYDGALVDHPADVVAEFAATEEWTMLWLQKT